MKMSTCIILASCAAIVVAVAGCMSAADHRESLGSTADRELTAGIVKKEIKRGMSGAEVAQALGSPNITTKDENGKETWVYDKIATEVSYSESNSAWFLILIGGSQRAGAASSTQRTLTVVVKFDDKDKVENFSYHQSKF